MLKDSIGLVVAMFSLILTYSVTSYFAFDLIDTITAQGSGSYFVSLNTILKGAYTMMYGILGVGIFYWYYNRMHREEYESDYFEQAGWRFESPHVPSPPRDMWRRYLRGR